MITSKIYLKKLSKLMSGMVNKETESYAILKREYGQEVDFQAKEDAEKKRLQARHDEVSDLRDVLEGSGELEEAAEVAYLDELIDIETRIEEIEMDSQAYWKNPEDFLIFGEEGYLL